MTDSDRAPSFASRRRMSFVDPDLTIDWFRANCTGNGVSVAVVDSGVDAAHPDLDKAVSRGCVVRSSQNGGVVCEEVAGDKCYDSYGHGTSVGRLIVDIAPDVKIVSVKVLNEYNTSTGEELLAGLEWTIHQRIKLVNMSLATIQARFFKRLFELSEQAYYQDTIIVASKRNFGPIGWPARFSSVIGVDRGDFNDPYHVKYQANDHIEYVAHGVGAALTGLERQLPQQSGSSFATARVTGIVALLLEAFPNLASFDVKTILSAAARADTA